MNLEKMVTKKFMESLTAELEGYVEGALFDVSFQSEAGDTFTVQDVIDVDELTEDDAEKAGDIWNGLVEAVDEARTECTNEMAQILLKATKRILKERT